MRLSKVLFNCLFIFFLCNLSQYAWSSQFVPVQLAYGLTMELPRNWAYADKEGQQLLETYAESVLRLAATHMEADGSELLILAKYPDPRTHAAVFVSADRISKSFGDFKGWNNEQLLKHGNDLRRDLEKSYTVSGNRLVEWLGTRKVNFKGIHSIQNRWRRSLKTNPVVCVEQTLIPIKDRIITISLSYREKDKVLWEPVVRAIYESLSF